MSCLRKLRISTRSVVSSPGAKAQFCGYRQALAFPGPRLSLSRNTLARLHKDLAHSASAEAWSRLGYDKRAQQEARQAFELAANS